MADLSEAISVSDAAKGLADGTPIEEQPEAETQELPEADEADSELEADTEGDEPGEEADSEPTEEQQELDDDEEELTFTVQMGDKEVDVTLDELTSGYLRQADYTRSKQALAEQRKATEAQAEQVSTRLAQLDQEFGSIEQLLLGTPPDMPAIELLHSDPAQYEVGKRQVEEWHATKQQLQTLRQGIADERAKEVQAEREKTVVSEGRAIIKEFDLKDQAAFLAKTGEIQAYLVTNGYSPQEASSVLDHRAYAIAEKARKWDEQHSKSKPGRLKVKKAKAKPVSSSARQPTGKRASNAKSRFNSVTQDPNATRGMQIDAGVAAFMESRRD